MHIVRRYKTKTTKVLHNIKYNANSNLHNMNMHVNKHYNLLYSH